MAVDGPPSAGDIRSNRSRINQIGPAQYILIGRVKCAE